jgi:hypothetical protein
MQQIQQTTCIKHVLSHIINYQQLSIAFAIIIRAELQECQEHNKLPNCIIETTQRYNSCLKLSTRSKF